MQTDYLISVDEFCASHNIKSAFITTLQKNGLIEITTIRDAVFVDSNQLQQLEKIVRLHYELDINLEGIETINYLLQRIISMQEEMVMLRNRLRLYENDL
jgi:chaperone modulatory protein CbpM